MEYSRWDTLPPFYGNTVVELSVPSGKIIAADSLRRTPFFDIESPLSINYGMGCDAWAKEYAAECNLGYAFVGNTCPSIVKHEDGHLEVVCFGEEEVDEDAIVASICTDLWATMITDYQNWLDNGGEEVTEAHTKWGDYQLIDVEPGNYQWTVYSHNDNFDTHGEGRLTFAELRKV